jgi:hypothetical protein
MAGSKDASSLTVDLLDLTIRYRPQLSALGGLSHKDVWNGRASPLFNAEQHRPIRAEAVVCTTLLMSCIRPRVWRTSDGLPLETNPGSVLTFCLGRVQGTGSPQRWSNGHPAAGPRQRLEIWCRS